MIPSRKSARRTTTAGLDKDRRKASGRRRVPDVRPWRSLRLPVSRHPGESADGVNPHAQEAGRPRASTWKPLIRPSTLTAPASRIIGRESSHRLRTDAKSEPPPGSLSHTYLRNHREDRSLSVCCWRPRSRCAIVRANLPAELRERPWNRLLDGADAELNIGLTSASTLEHGGQRADRELECHDRSTIPRRIVSRFAVARPEPLDRPAVMVAIQLPLWNHHAKLSFSQRHAVLVLGRQAGLRPTYRSRSRWSRA